MQQYADIYLLQSLYMFRVSQHPSSGVLKIVSATSGTAISFQRGLVRTGVSESCGIYFFLYFVFSTPDDGCCDTRNM